MSAAGPAVHTAPRCPCSHPSSNPLWTPPTRGAHAIVLCTHLLCGEGQALPLKIGGIWAIPHVCVSSSFLQVGEDVKGALQGLRVLVYTLSIALNEESPYARLQLVAGADGRFGFAPAGSRRDQENCSELCWPLQHSTAPHSTTHHGTTHHSTTHHHTSQHHTAPHITAPHITAPHSTTLHSTTQRHTSQYQTSQHHTAPHFTAPHSTTQHHTAPHSTAPHTTTHHSIKHHSTTQHSITQHSTTQHSTTHHSTTHHSTTHHSTTAQHHTAQTSSQLMMW